MLIPKSFNEAGWVSKQVSLRKPNDPLTVDGLYKSNWSQAGERTPEEKTILFTNTALYSAKHPNKNTCVTE